MDVLVVGHVPKPHGTRGEVFIWPLTDRPGEVFAPGREVIVGDEEGRAVEGEPTLRIERVRHFKGGLLVKFRDHGDRNSVEFLAGRYVLAPLETLAPLEEGEYFYHQLLGMEVVTVDGEVVGRVREVYETEPVHLLEVVGDGKERLIPFAERLIREIDTEARRLVIEPPAGLLEI